MSFWLLEQISRVKALKLQQDLIDALPDKYEVGFKDKQGEKLMVSLPGHKPFVVSSNAALSMTPKALAKQAMIGMMLPTLTELKAQRRPGNRWALTLGDKPEDPKFSIAAISSVDAPLRVICRRGESGDYIFNTVTGVGDVWSSDGLKRCIETFAKRSVATDASNTPEVFE